MSALAYSRHESQISTQGEPSFQEPQGEASIWSALPPRPTTPIDESIPAWEPPFNTKELGQLFEGNQGVNTPIQEDLVIPTTP
jgi:hypothetical protein